MTTTLVPVSSAFDVIGPYLAAKAECPACRHVNVLVHIESYTSPVKPVSLCQHIAAHQRDADGNGFIEFQH